MNTKPKRCFYPDCFHCPYVDCRWNSDPTAWAYNHSEPGKLRDKRYMESEKGKEAQMRYAKSDKGKARDKRKQEKKVKSGKNAEYCRRYYKTHRLEIMRKKREKKETLKVGEKVDTN